MDLNETFEADFAEVTKKYNTEPDPLEPETKLETEIYTLISKGTTTQEVADFYEIDLTTLETSYQKVITKGKAAFKIYLRDLQYNSAANSVQMQTHLGGDVLGQAEKKSTEVKGDLFSNLTDEQIKARLELDKKALGLTDLPANG